MVRLVHLYQFKFSEFFGNHAGALFEKIWGLVSNDKINASRECERLIFALVRYFGDCSGL